MLSSVDVLGNLQYFKSEKAEDVRNLNYLERSVHTALFFTHGKPIAYTLQEPSSPSPTSKKGHRFSRAIGSTVDGVAHVTSRVTVLPLLILQFSRGIASGLSSLLHDDQFSFQRRARINRSSDQRFARSRVSGDVFPRLGIWVASSGSGVVEWCEGSGCPASPRHQGEGIPGSLHGTSYSNRQP